MAIRTKGIALGGEDFLEIIDTETNDSLIITKEGALELLAQLTEKLK